jgi:hypothetical protein
VGCALFGALLAAVAAPAAAAPPPIAIVVDCSRHIEDGRGPIAPAAKDLLAPRIALHGWRRAAAAAPARFRSIPRERWRVWKAGPLVRAGRAVTLVVPGQERARLRLGWQGGSSAIVRFEPCDPDRKAFSYDGRIGGWTAFSGALLVRAPGCRRLEIWLDGATRPVVRTLAFGVRACP